MSGFGNRVIQMLVNQIVDKLQLHRLPFVQRFATRTVRSMKSMEDLVIRLLRARDAIEPDGTRVLGIRRLLAGRL